MYSIRRCISPTCVSKFKPVMHSHFIAWRLFSFLISRGNYSLCWKWRVCLKMEFNIFCATFYSHVSKACDEKEIFKGLFESLARSHMSSYYLFCMLKTLRLKYFVIWEVTYYFVKQNFNTICINFNSANLSITFRGLQEVIIYVIEVSICTLDAPIILYITSWKKGKGAYNHRPIS